MGPYTFGGAASSSLLGAGLGAVGSAFAPVNNNTYGIAIATIGTLCVARELLRPSWRVPQVARQTRDRWVKTLGPGRAAFLWGLDIGLVLTTWITFSGAWFVIALAFLSGSPVYGAAILAAYWGGRSLSVWLAPMMAFDAVHVPELMATLRSFRGRVQLMHAFVLSSCIGLVVLALIANRELLR